MRKTWLIIGLIIVLTITGANINFGRFMDAHAAEKAKKPSKKPDPAPAPAIAVDTMAKSAVKNAYTASQAYFSDEPSGFVTLDKLIKYGLRLPPEVTLIIQSAKRESLSLAASHKKGSYTYLVDFTGTINERKGLMASTAVAPPAPAAKKVEEKPPRPSQESTPAKAAGKDDIKKRLLNLADAIDQEPLYKLNPDGIRNALFSPPDGRYLAISDDGNLCIYDTATWEQINCYSFNFYMGFKSHVYDFAFSEDGKYFAVTMSDGPVHVFEVGTWKEVFKEKKVRGYSVSFSPDNRYLAIGQGYPSKVLIYKYGTWDLVTNVSVADNYYISSIIFSTDSRYIVATSSDQGPRIFEVDTWKKVKELERGFEGDSFTFSPDMTYMLHSRRGSYSRGDVYVYNTVTWEGPQRVFNELDSVGFTQFSSDGRYFIAASRKEVLNLFSQYSNYSTNTPINNFDFKAHFGGWLIGNRKGKSVVLDMSRMNLISVINEFDKLGFTKHGDKLNALYDEIENDLKNKISLITSEKNAALAKLGNSQKDEFETEPEYQKRIANRESGITDINLKFEDKRLSFRRESVNKRSRLFEQYEKELGRLLIASRGPVNNLKPSLGTYVADAEIFPITVAATGIEPLKGIVRVPRGNARNFKEKIDQFQVSGDAQLERTGKKKLINVVINNSETGETYYLAKTSSPQGQVATLPPSLSATGEFFEPSGDRALNAEETGKLIVRIKNIGEGSAYRVVARPVPSEAIADLSYDPEKVVPEIGPNSEQEITFPLIAGLDLPEKQAQFKIEFEEKNGLPPNPVKVQFQTRAVLKPDLQVIDYVIDDANKDGMIQQEEVIKVTFRVQNKGQGAARNAKAKVTLSDNIFQALNIPLENELGEMKPDEVKQFTVAFYTNQKIKDKVPLKVDLIEARPRFNTEKQYALSMNVKEKTVFETVVAAKVQEVVKITDLESPSDLEQDIPSTGVINRNAVAVVIGNYDYKNVQKVSFARRDAVVMKEYLVKTFGYDPGNIIFLPDATLSDLLNALGSAGAAKRSKLSSYLRPGSEIFVYYTGHGAPGLQDKKGYLVPIDADPNNIETTGYSLETLYRNLESLNASKLTVVIDACFSGDSQAGMLFKDASPIMVQAKSDKLNTGTVITSSSGDQISSWYPEKKHSLFTYFFLKGIKDKATRKEPVAIQDLKVYVIDEVDRMSRRLYNRIQTPGFEGNLEERLID